MRHDDIVSDIQGGKQGRGVQGVDSSSMMTLAQARDQFTKKSTEENNARITQNIQEQAKLEAALRAKGLTEADALWKKLLGTQAKEGAELSTRFQQIADKQKKNQDLKDLKEVYEYGKNLDKELAENKKELNKAILESDIATDEEKAQAKKELQEQEMAEWMDSLPDKLSGAVSQAVNQTLNELNGLMKTYSDYQAKMNGRLQGTFMTWSRLENNLTTAVGIQPYVKNQDMVENLAGLVESGVAYNLELRAFIQTIKENIADTFDATNGTLLRLIRLQQADSTASRLGLEGALTRYFNRMYQDTSYLTDAFDNVTDALLEASSTMSNKQAVAFEHQVQKWLGSLYGVGLSTATVQGIAEAIGMLGSGNVSGLAGSQYQNLLVMAASRAGLSYGELLTGGLNASNTDILLESMVEYLKEIANSTNKVVQSELGRVFGVSMSDLQSALNLNTNVINNIAGHDMDYNATLMELVYQLSALPTRMSIATMMDNLWDNLEWGLASNVAKNPALYGIWKVTDMIQQYTGGIALPSVFAMGSGFNLNTTIENLIKMGVVGIGSLGMIGDLVSGLSSSLFPATMYLKLQALSNIEQTGRGLATSLAGLSESSTTVVGNSSGEDVSSSTTNQAQGDNQQAVADASSENEAGKVVETIRDDVSEIKFMIQKLDMLIGPDGLRISTMR